MLSEKQLALATGALWSLQEAVITIDSLLLTHTYGLTITSTMDGSDRSQRIAAVSATLFRLCERASDLWGRGEAQEIALKLHDTQGDYHILMHPVGYQAMLLAVTSENSAQLLQKLARASHYLEAVLAGDTPGLPDWHIGF